MFTGVAPRVVRRENDVPIFVVLRAVLVRGVKNHSIIAENGALCTCSRGHSIRESTGRKFFEEAMYRAGAELGRRGNYCSFPHYFLVSVEDKSLSGCYASLRSIEGECALFPTVEE